MSKTAIKNALRPLLHQEVKSMGPEGLALAGIALLVHGFDTPTNHAEDVVEAHKKFGIVYEGPPRLLPNDVAQFRRNREIEELDEFEEARLAGDIVKCFDAILDEMYYLLGKAQLCGFTPEMLEQGWKRIHEANMAKVPVTSEHPGRDGCKQDFIKPPGWKAPFHYDIIGKAIAEWNAAHQNNSTLDVWNQLVKQKTNATNTTENV